MKKLERLENRALEELKNTTMQHEYVQSRFRYAFGQTVGGSKNFGSQSFGDFQGLEEMEKEDGSKESSQVDHREAFGEIKEEKQKERMRKIDKRKANKSKIKSENADNTTNFQSNHDLLAKTDSIAKITEDLRNSKKCEGIKSKPNLTTFNPNNEDDTNNSNMPPSPDAEPQKPFQRTSTDKDLQQKMVGDWKPISLKSTIENQEPPKTLKEEKWDF